MSDSPFAPTTHHIIPSDNTFQRRARLLQSLWRIRQGFAIGQHRGRPLGSCLAMPAARDQLNNYLTETIRDVVWHEVLDSERNKNKRFDEPAIFDDLLASQALSFNLFGELQQNLPLASRVFSRLTFGRMAEVMTIEFETSPGRGLGKHGRARLAFDVFVEYRSESGQKGFAGIEVRYHEDLDDKPAPPRQRNREITHAMGCFDPAALERLEQRRLQDIWRHHLLAGSLRLDQQNEYRDGFFAFLYPADNECCDRAMNGYAACLTDRSTFVGWTLEMVASAIKTETAASWINAFEDRYLAFDELC